MIYNPDTIFGTSGGVIKSVGVTIEISLISPGFIFIICMKQTI